MDRQAAAVQVPAQLRLTQVWGDTVLDEKTFNMGEATIGFAPGVAFHVPDGVLPERHPLFAFTDVGLALNLHHGMTGHVSLSGRQQRVGDLLGEGTRQRAVLVGPTDWGLIELHGGHRFYFQLGTPAARLDGSIAAWVIGLIALLGYSAFVHSVLAALMFIFYDPNKDDKFIDPTVTATLLAPKELVIEPPKPEEKKGEEALAAIPEGEDKAKPASTMGDPGKSGGEGDRPRARDPEPPPKGDPMVAKVINRGVLKHRDKLAALGDRDAVNDRLTSALSRMRGPLADGTPGSGTGTGTGVGPGSGTGTLTRGTGLGAGGGGTSHADIVTAERIETGGSRPPRGAPGGTGVKEAKVTVSTGTPDGDFGDLTPEQIQKVVMAHRGAIQYCFEKELQRVPGLEGKVVLTWRIDGSGKVTSSKVKSSTMGNAAVEDCLARQVRGWKFPAPSGGSQAVVNYPFLFARR